MNLPIIQENHYDSIEPLYSDQFPVPCDISDDSMLIELWLIKSSDVSKDISKNCRRVHIFMNSLGIENLKMLEFIMPIIINRPLRHMLKKMVNLSPFNDFSEN